MNQKKTLIGIIIILLVVIGLLIWKNAKTTDTETVSRSQENVNTPTPTPSPSVTPTQPEAADIHTFEKDLEANGFNWTLSRVTVNKKNIDMNVNVSAPLTLQFKPAEKQYTGFAGCNSFSGTYKSSGSLAFDFGATVSTKKACPASMELENGIFQAMDKISNFGIKGNQLVFTSEDGFTELVYNQAI